MIDWDIHHGDGTQAIFEHDPSVYCISIHSVIDLYMMKVTSIEAGTTEYAKKIGQCNIPLLHRIFDAKFFAEIDLHGDFYRDNESIPAFQQSLETLPFTPDIVFVFAGCDSHKDDCGRDITNWETLDFETLTKSVIALSRKANCPILSSGCGGYNLKSTVAVIEAHVRTLATG
jgi:acetoin utilization deacetylase AcuC-like enzyme